MTYGCRIEWRFFWGNKSTVEITGCNTFEEARRRALIMAREAGWTPKRWWQWWRWGDTSNLKEYRIDNAS